MYNGIGLATPRGSGTNGHVQRNWALVKPRTKEKTYKTEEELSALDTTSNRQPNKEILDHERKRKIELKCAEFADILEDQGFSEEAINNKVNNYRDMLIGQGGKTDKPVDQWGRPCVTETHQVAEAQQEKNARLREAFGISEYFVDGSSFDQDRHAKEKLAKSEASLEKEKQKAIDQGKEKNKAQTAHYQLVHTPSPEPRKLTNEVTAKKKKRKHRDRSSSEEPKKKKKRKNRKRDRSAKLKEKKRSKKRKSDHFSPEKSSSSSEGESSSEDEKKKKKKKNKEKRKSSRKRRRSSSENSRQSSSAPNVKSKLEEGKRSSRNEEKYSYDKSKPSYSKREHVASRSPLRNSKENNIKEYSKSSKAISSIVNSKRSRSRETRRKSKSPEIINVRTSSPFESQKDKNSYLISKGERSKGELSKSKMLQKSRRSRASSRSRSKERSPRRSRSQSITQIHKLERQSNKKKEKENIIDRKQSPGTDGKTSVRSPVSPRIHKRRGRTSSSPRANKFDCQNESQKTRLSQEKSFSPIQLNNNKLNAHKLSGSRTKLSDTIPHKDNSDENVSDQEKSYKSMSPFSIREQWKDKNRYNEDKNIERNYSYSSCSKTSLTPEIRSKPNTNSTSRCKSRSKTPEIKTSLKRNDKHKLKKPLPVVRLRASSSEPDPSGNEFEKEEEEDDKEFKILKMLKSDLAAKAKESLEKKLERRSSSQHFKTNIEPDLFDIKVLPLKIDKPVSQDRIHTHDFGIKEKVIKTRSRSIQKSKSKSRSSSNSSTSSRNSQRSNSTFSCSTHSPSPIRTVSRSGSNSTSSSSSTDSTSTRSRSPSIPRRHGSPSFLDRRRITRPK